jgi:hypothetical protein
MTRIFIDDDIRQDLQIDPGPIWIGIRTPHEPDASEINDACREEIELHEQFRREAGCNAE